MVAQLQSLRFSSDLDSISFCWNIFGCNQIENVKLLSEHFHFSLSFCFYASISLIPYHKLLAYAVF